MRLLFDENLSPKLPGLLADVFPDSLHVEDLDFRGKTDSFLWDYARTHGLVLVSKDNDFRQRAFLWAPPPKVIWLSIGNAGTQTVVRLLRQSVPVLARFAEEKTESLCVLSTE